MSLYQGSLGAGASNRVAKDLALGPDQLQLLADAFERAWRVVESDFIPGSQREEARSRLAGIALSLARDGIYEVSELAARAVQLLRADIR